MNGTLGNIVLDYFFKGGPVMWPILLALLAALTVILERSLWWWALRRRTDSARLSAAFNAVSAGDFARALALADKSPADPFLATLRAGIQNAHSSLLGA